MRQNFAAAVRTALHELCEKKGPAEGLFRTYYSAKTVSEKAGVSESTARKHLDRITFNTLGYSSTVIGGTRGYRHFSY